MRGPPWATHLPLNNVASAWPPFAARTPSRNASCGRCCIDWDTGSDCTQPSCRAIPTSSCRVCVPLSWCMGASGIRTPASEVGVRRRVTPHSGERNVPSIRAEIGVILLGFGVLVGGFSWCGNARPPIWSDSPSDSRHSLLRAREAEMARCDGSCARHCPAALRHGSASRALCSDRFRSG